MINLENREIWRGIQECRSTGRKMNEIILEGSFSDEQDQMPELRRSV